MKGHILAAKINTYIGGMFVLAFGLFALHIGFQIEEMENPIVNVLAEQAMLAQ